MRRNKATGLPTVFQISNVLSPFARRNLKCYLYVGKHAYHVKLEAVMAVMCPQAKSTKP